MENENFYEMVNDYLDPNDIKDKYNCDKSLRDKIKNRNQSPFGIEDTITMNDFVNNFLNIKCDASNLYHCGLKQLNCPYVVGVSNNFANKNPEYVKLGLLLLVIDANNNRGTYINPFYLNMLMEKEKNNQSNDDIILETSQKTTDDLYSILQSEKKLKKLKLIRKYEGIGE